MGIFRYHTFESSHRRRFPATPPALYMSIIVLFLYIESLRNFLQKTYCIPFVLWYIPRSV